MQQKIEAVKVELQSAFSDSTLDYQFSDDLHKFRINFPTHAHWLIIDSETLEDCSIDGLRNLLIVYQVIQALKESQFSRRILLTRHGATDQPISNMKKLWPNLTFQQPPQKLRFWSAAEFERWAPSNS